MIVEDNVKELVSELATKYKCSKSFIYIMLPEFENLKDLEESLALGVRDYHHDGIIFTTISDVSKYVGCSQTNIKNRLLKNQKLCDVIDFYMSKTKRVCKYEKELEVLGFKTLKDFCDKHKIHRQRMYYLMSKRGMTMQEAIKHCEKIDETKNFEVCGYVFKNQDQFCRYTRLSRGTFWHYMNKGYSYEKMLERHLGVMDLETVLRETGYFNENVKGV